MAGRSLLLVARVALVGVVAALALGVTTASGDSSGAPVVVTQPEVHGVPGVGKTLRVTNGTWSTSATFTYQWERCSAHFADCTDIPGATTATYRAVHADAGHVLGAMVTATNAAGSTSATPSGLGPIEGERPGVKHLPWIKGTKQVGQRLLATDVRWTRAPYQFTYQWLRCSAKGSACVRITGEEKICYSDGTCLRVTVGRGFAYRPTAKDVGHRLRVRVAAWNGAGRSTATSAPTRIIVRG